MAFKISANAALFSVYLTEVSSSILSKYFSIISSFFNFSLTIPLKCSFYGNSLFYIFSSSFYSSVWNFLVVALVFACNSVLFIVKCNLSS